MGMVRAPGVLFIQRGNVRSLLMAGIFGSKYVKKWYPLLNNGRVPKIGLGMGGCEDSPKSCLFHGAGQCENPFLRRKIVFMTFFAFRFVFFCAPRP